VRATVAGQTARLNTDNRSGVSHSPTHPKKSRDIPVEPMDDEYRR
jgi:hypothetical protein